VILDFKQVQHTFLPLYHKLKSAKKRYIVNLGGSGSGKSFSSHQLELLNLLSSEAGDTLVLRKNSSNIRLSCYKLFKEIALLYNIHHFFKWTYSGDNRAIISKHTGKGIYFSGANDIENLKSTAGMKRVLMEEASQFTFDDFLEITRRVRGYNDIQYILNLNPISERHWIKTELLDKPEWKNDVQGFKTTYLNNPFLSEQDRLYYETLKVANYDQYRIYALALWGIENRESKFAYNFQQGKYTGLVTFNASLPVYLSFDFNVEPLTCTAWQFRVGEFCLCIDEFKLENSDVTSFGNMIFSKYGNVELYITGDASEKTKRNFLGALNAYDQLRNVLRVSPYNTKVPNSNPSISVTRNLLNKCIATHPNWFISRECKGLIYDLNHVEIDANGDIDKGDRNNIKKRADFLDTARYFHNTFLSAWMKV